MSTKIMSPWKKVLIVGLCVFATAALVFVCLMAYFYYDRFHKSSHWEDLARPISKNILMVPGKKGNKDFVRLQDVRTGKYTTPKLQHIFVNNFATEDSLVVFRTFDRLRGYLNINTGEIIIPAQYNRAWNFSEGVAAVLKDGVISFIKADGKPAFDAVFPIYYQDDFNEIAPQFHNGLCVMRSAENKWGLINTRGEWVVEPVYASIYVLSHGYRIVTDGSKYGLISESGEIALPLEYDFIRPASDQAGFVLAKDGFAEEVDVNLNVTIPFIYDGLYLMDYVDLYRSNIFQENGTSRFIVPKYWRYDVGAGSGVIDNEGNVIVPAKYYMVRIVDDTLFEVEVTCGGDRILFNNKGQYVGKSKF